MGTTRPRWSLMLLAAGWFAPAARAAAPEVPALPPAAGGPVDFEAQVRPILQARCIKCHARGKLKGGLSLETREAILKGGEGGPAAVPGKGAESLLVALVGGLEPDRRMPDKGDPLTPAEVGVLRAWIDRGMAWPAGFSFGFRQAPIAPRAPEQPQSPAGMQPIDRFVAKYFAEQGVAADWTPVTDRAYARRVSLDLVGLLPTPEQLAAFEADRRPDKRAKLVEALLGDRRAYADHWLSFWNDALRNAYRGAGFIDGGRQPITGWLYRSLYENAPYDRFVRELISPVAGSEGFTKGIVWRGVVNSSQLPPVQAAQNVAQVFLGTNLKCASCHDSFVNHWKLADAYALASVFAEAPLEIHRCDKPTGKTSAVGSIYPQLGAIDASAPRPERMRRLAEVLVSPADGRFARTIVNRLWAHALGLGIVEPLDDMDQAPWSQDLLDWLAADLVTHKYDLKHTLATICTSRTYQLPSVGVAAPGERGPHAFRGPRTRRLTAEQFADALAAVTGAWPEPTDEMVKVDGRGQGGQVAAIRAAIAATGGAGGGPIAPKVEARWIWSHDDAARDPGGRILLRKVIRLDEVPDRAVASATCDNEFALYVNGRQVARGADWSRPEGVDITKDLKRGANVIAVEATNWPDPANGRGVQFQGPNPAAFMAWIGGFQADRQAWGVGTDASWLWSKQGAADWKTRADDDGWHHAAELPAAPATYGNVDLAAAIGRATPAVAGPTRAVLAFDDPLLAALGRTRREQVVTRREAIASTLQALELTNGATLDRMLRQGATRLIERHGKEPGPLIRGVYLGALGREPSGAELAAAGELIGESATPDGVQDLLWVVTMLPEFQLIR